jgi:FXSXX-COOH protein
MTAGDTTGRDAGCVPLPESEVVEPALPDLSGVSLAELRHAVGTPITRSIERLLREAADPGEATAGFNSAV